MTIEILQKEAASVLTPQQRGKGFLASDPHPFTHTLSGYVGCGFGQTTCGLYCYAQFLPNWQFRRFPVDAPAAWGEAVQVKTNAARLLEKALSGMRPTTRQGLRIFMSSFTDPYQPIERQYRINRGLTSYPNKKWRRDALSCWLWGVLYRPIDLIAYSRYAWGQTGWGALCPAQ
jgi:hypothetical protein